MRKDTIDKEDCIREIIQFWICTKSPFSKVTKSLSITISSGETEWRGGKKERSITKTAIIRQEEKQSNKRTA